MGSITAIFLLPFLSVFAIFVGIFETFMGIGNEKVALPYDPQNGIVWEYKEGDEAYIDCIKNEIIDGQQVFTFRGKRVFDKERPTSTYYENTELVDDIYFEDKNGNIKNYYAFVNFSSDPGMGGSMIYGKTDIYEETECATIRYTVKAKEPTEDAYWLVYDYKTDRNENRYIGEYKLDNSHERTYQFVFPPEDIYDQTFNMAFYYRTSSGKQFERIGVTFEMKDKEVKVVEEIFYVKDENGVFVDPDTNEPYYK